MRKKYILFIITVLLTSCTSINSNSKSVSEIKNNKTELVSLEFNE